MAHPNGRYTSIKDTAIGKPMETIIDGIITAMKPAIFSAMTIHQATVMGL